MLLMSCLEKPQVPPATGATAAKTQISPLCFKTTLAFYQLISE